VLASTGEPVPPPALSTDESLTYWVVQHQEPVVIPCVEGETRFPQAVAYMRSQGMGSTCALPLTTPRRHIGLICTASREPHTYDREGVTFLRLVANQVALAIDDALNYGALQQALAAASERAQSLEASDELLRALSPVLDVRDVFPRISEIAARVLPHDLLTLTFFDETGAAVRAASHDYEWFAEARLKLADSSRMDDGTFTIVDDLVKETFEIIEPADCSGRVARL
jgi:formate hydrogenlyase transcriptional activator